MASLSLEAIKAKTGQEIGVSGWILIDQAKIDAFADVTGDHQFIHVDPVRAAQTPFGGTIAHGLLTLSMLPAFAYQVLPPNPDVKFGVNYGYDKVRFLAPVKSGKRIRGRFVQASADDSQPGRLMTVYTVTVEIEDEPKPALAADWRTLAFL